MSESRTRTLRWGTLAIVLLAMLFLAMLANRRNQTLGVGETVQYDDFFFTVEKADRMNQAPTPDLAADRDDYLVRLRIDNRAKRVDYQFRGERLVFADLTGNDSPIGPVAQRSASGEFKAPEKIVLRAGESATVDFLYSLPRDHRDLRLRVTSGPFGDLLQWLIAGRTEFLLP
jgi:hypothetical protein